MEMYDKLLQFLNQSRGLLDYIVFQLITCEELDDSRIDKLTTRLMAVQDLEQDKLMHNLDFFVEAWVDRYIRERKRLAKASESTNDD